MERFSGNYGFECPAFKDRGTEPPWIYSGRKSAGLSNILISFLTFLLCLYSKHHALRALIN